MITTAAPFAPALAREISPNVSRGLGEDGAARPAA
jgi:hypothetical protein